MVLALILGILAGLFIIKRISQDSSFTSKFDFRQFFSSEFKTGPETARGFSFPSIKAGPASTRPFGFLFPPEQSITTSRSSRGQKGKFGTTSGGRKRKL